ncbi:MAG: hypothetical protein [Bacteriophage sp.]|nr:MAG: hypothetical protein [Bacteriophage sp.]
MINHILLLLIGWVLHIGKIYYPERNTISLVDYIEAHAFEFTGSVIFALAIFYGQWLDGASTYLNSFATGYMLNSIWQGIKNNHFNA